MYFKLLVIFCLWSSACAGPLLYRRSGKEPSPPEKTEIQVGDMIGVRPTAYEVKTKENARVNIHPGAVIRKRPNGHLEVAMISKKLPGDPPQRPIAEIHPSSGLIGNMDLGPLRVVDPAHAKIWKPNNRLPPDTVARVRDEIAANSRSPSSTGSQHGITSPFVQGSTSHPTQHSSTHHRRSSDATSQKAEHGNPATLVDPSVKKLRSIPIHTSNLAYRPGPVRRDPHVFGITMPGPPNARPGSLDSASQSHHTKEFLSQSHPNQGGHSDGRSRGGPSRLSISRSRSRGHPPRPHSDSRGQSGRGTSPNSTPLGPRQGRSVSSSQHQNQAQRVFKKRKTDGHHR